MTPGSNDSPNDLRLYGDLAPWWPVLSAPEEYEEEATHYAELLVERSVEAPASLLELGSGGGNNASYMKRRFEHVTLVDLSPAMLEVSRGLNPDCEHHVGDMRSVRLDRLFDCVFVHDAICYATSIEDLRSTMETAFIHCRPGGLALFVPDYVLETFKPSTSHGGHDGLERSLRYLAWTREPSPGSSTYTVDYAFLYREGEGPVECGHERHVEGLFPRATWLKTLEDVGFEPSTVSFQHSEVDHDLHLFFGAKPEGVES